jgi:hypothetical protein
MVRYFMEKSRTDLARSQDVGHKYGIKGTARRANAEWNNHMSRIIHERAVRRVESNFVNGRNLRRQHRIWQDSHSGEYRPIT